MPTSIRKVLCFGSSSMYGYGDALGWHGWAGRLQTEFHRSNLDQDPYTQPLAAFYNLSIIGSTAERLSRQIPRDIAARSPKTKLMLNILSIGLNDSAVYKSGGAVVSLDKYTSALEEVALFATAGGAKAIFIGITTFEEKKCYDFRGKGISYLKDRALEFEDAAAAVFGKHLIPSVPLFNASLESDFDSMLSPDGLHPNFDGHEWIYARVAPTVKELWT
ncbi:SGNH/GDSL hydrolase family protein [Gordonia rubripertincta]|uniref:GDSL-type esterase/lipase family protein n=1 Tax=Gordonia rubripertincta TaxID=36822 RepID=A0ABT4MXQ9_GORRU|nr:GDSL-type esterase/lipase family protein [Gordonia rubripertincta]